MNRTVFACALSLATACATSPAQPPSEGSVAHVNHPGTALAPAPSPAACGMADLQVVPHPASYQVGGFSITIDGEARLRIDHADAPTAQTSAAAGPAFTATRTALHVEEHQGSFTVDADESTGCSAPQVDGVAHGAGGLSVSGHFLDCPGIGWSLTMCAPRPAHLQFALTTSDDTLNDLRLRLRSDSGERIYGMGEQFPHDRLDLKGRMIPVLSQEGGVGRGHTPITQAVNLASSGSGGSEASTYYAAPHYLTNRHRSLFLENTEYAEFDFRGDEVIELRVLSRTMTGRFLAGGSPLELIERFTEWAGRMPPLPTWVDNGAIVALARNLDDSRTIVDQLRAHGAEIAGVWNQTWSGKARTFIGEQVLWNWVQNPNFHPGWNDFVDGLAADGIRTLCYINPMLVDPPDDAGPVRRNLFAEAKAAGYLVRNGDGDVYLMPVTAFEVGLIDLTNPAARQWMKQVIQDELVGRAGCSGWMADFGEALPFDAVLASGVDAATYHNQYPVEWMKLNRQAAEEAGLIGDVLIFNRSGAARSPRHSLLLWQGDQLTTWDKYDGLVSALRGLIGGGFSGIALNHSDTGGYTSLSLSGIAGYEREPEQLERWTEMNAFTAVLRTHEGNQPDVNAQAYTDDAAMAHFARFTKVYKALAFYRRQLFADAANRGWPVVRHLWMHYPDDETAQTVDDQFLLGREILVAPIKNKCWTWPWCRYDKSVYLPKGRWVHLWSGRVYGDAEAGSTISVRAPIGEPAVFFRRGSSVGAQFVANLRAAGINAGAPE